MQVVETPVAHKTTQCICTLVYACMLEQERFRNGYDGSVFMGADIHRAYGTHVYTVCTHVC